MSDEVVRVEDHPVRELFDDEREVEPAPAEDPAPFVRKIGPDTEWTSVHIRDELEPSETLCGRFLDRLDLEAWTSLPSHLKSCESCLRIRTERDHKPKSKSKP